LAGAGSRFLVCFHLSFAASLGGVKGTDLIRTALPGFTPTGAVPDDPIREGVLKTNIMTGLFGFNPLVPEDFLALGLKFAVKRRAF